MAKFKPEDIPDLHRKVAIVTGGNRGMGFHIVQQLASHGAKVYLAARSEASAREAIQRIEAEKPELQGKDRVVYLKLDLSTLQSAQDSANEYLRLEQRLDIIVHNAGIMNHPYAKTADGLEDSMGIKYVECLLYGTSRQPESDVRVVIVSSSIHSRAPAAGKFATLDEINDPLAPPSSQDGIVARYARYARSKLANILYAKQLQKEFDASSSTALAISLHPGGVATETVLDDQESVPFLGPVLKFLVAKLAKSPLDGALVALHAATSPDVRKNSATYGGAYIGSLAKVTPASADGQSDDLAKKLWEVTEQISTEILSE
ncbi:hypothetical protein PC9H_011358 [Pleurotus ostreatus]|uniref:Uncharacterized protein n=1 Tax=Pleurotus ostreatus TaxID=5322 RepID=A0A8H6ZLC0_PLEOS|nr:uncharacterized protein PC9H_011358 [Pleurotus ostreatus]KAF7420840.1 hypothetical protein PC9H_011358 [Pleurotus ostreatus]